MAGFKTWHIDAIRNGVDRLVKRYEGVLKSRAKTSEDAIAKICAVEMVDENGENTSKGEHQAECVWNNAEQWNIIPRTLGMCFDTTASNAGCMVLHLRCVH